MDWWLLKEVARPRRQQYTSHHLWREEEQKVVIEDNNNESTDIYNYGNGRQMATYIALHFKLCWLIFPTNRKNKRLTASPLLLLYSTSSVLDPQTGITVSSRSEISSPRDQHESSSCHYDGLFRRSYLRWQMQGLKIQITSRTAGGPDREELREKELKCATRHHFFCLPPSCYQLRVTSGRPTPARQVIPSNFTISFSTSLLLTHYTTQGWASRAFYNGLRRHSECMYFTWAGRSL